MENENIDSNKSQRKRKNENESTIAEMPASSTKRKKSNTPDDELTKIEALSDEILVEVIKFLPIGQWPSLEGVNRQFRRSVLGAWSGLKEIRLGQDLGVFCSTIADKKGRKKLRLVLRKLLNRSPSLSSLVIDCKVGYNLYSITYVRLLSRFENLITVDFGFGMRSEELELANFLDMTASRGQLKEVQMIGRSKSDVTVDEDVLEAAFGNENRNSADELLKLEKFTLEEGKPHTTRIFGFMDVSRLTTLNVCPTKIDPADFLSLLDRARNLTHLDFSFASSCRNPGNGVHSAQNKEILRRMSTTLNNLSSLKIGFEFPRCLETCFRFHSELAAMIREFGRRRQLDELALMARWLCTDETISAISDNMTYLKSLELGVDDSDVDSTSDLIDLATKLKRLEKLSLLPCRITNGLLSAVSDNLIQLKYLDLEGSIDESKSFERLTSLGNLKDLRLHVIPSGEYPNKMETSTLAKLGERLGSRLESLELTSDASVTDEGLISLSNESPGLRNLNLRRTEITDDVLRSFAAHCSSLRDLDVSECRNVSVEGVQAVVDGCQQLKRLIIYGEDHNRAFGELKLGKYRNMFID